MKKRKKVKTNGVKEFGTALGVGLVAGFAGTVAITVSQGIEMKLTKREPSTVPADAVNKTLDIQPADGSDKLKLAEEVHWTYGTSLGIARGLMRLAGLKGWPATAAHFAAVWGGSMIMLPALELAPPVSERKPKSFLIDGLHHAVYAVAAGLVFDAIMDW